MRRFLVIVVASLVPVGMWTAGCRQERQAAFPDTPEMASLAKSGKIAEAESPTTPPEIPPAPIDRDIMNLSERGVLARMQAVSDRAEKLAGREPDDGLFTLPDLSGDVASAAPANLDAAPAAASRPIPSGREFWSKPVASRTTGPVQVPADISAMAPASTQDFIETPPPHYQAPAVPAGQRLLPPEDVPGIFMVDDDPLSSIHSPPASRHSGLGQPGGDALSAPPFSSASAARPMHGQMRSVDDSRKATARVSQRGPIRLDLSGLVPPAARETASASARHPVEDIQAMAPAPRAVIPEYQAVRVPIMTLSTSPVHEPLPEPVPVSSLNGVRADVVSGPHPLSSVQSIQDYEPIALPPVPTASAAPASTKDEWVASPLAASRPSVGSSVTKTLASSATMSLPVPMGKSARTTAKPASAPLPFEELPAMPEIKSYARARSHASDDITAALAPLPDLSAGTSKTAAAVQTARTPEPLSAPASRPAEATSASTLKASDAHTATASKRAGRIPEVTLPQPVADPLPTPELAAAKSVLMDFSPESLDEVSLPASFRNGDFFKTDFWESKSAAPALPVDAPAPAAKLPSRPIPELPMPSAPNRAEAKAPAAPVKKAAVETIAAPIPREPIWVDSMPKDSVPEYRYEVAPRTIAPTQSAQKTRIDTVEARKESTPPAPKKIKLKPIGKNDAK